VVRDALDGHSLYPVRTHATEDGMPYDRLRISSGNRGCGSDRIAMGTDING
jgi:hypothetical protein